MASRQKLGRAVGAGLVGLVLAGVGLFGGGCTSQQVQEKAEIGKPAVRERAKEFKFSDFGKLELMRNFGELKYNGEADVTIQVVNKYLGVNSRFQESGNRIKDSFGAVYRGEQFREIMLSVIEFNSNKGLESLISDLQDSMKQGIKKALPLIEKDMEKSLKPNEGAIYWFDAETDVIKGVPCLRYREKNVKINYDTGARLQLTEISYMFVQGRFLLVVGAFEKEIPGDMRTLLEGMIDMYSGR